MSLRKREIVLPTGAMVEASYVICQYILNKN